MTDARILLVEDDDLNQRLVAAVLARSADPLLSGACLIQAGSLAEARTALARDAVDVVLLDMNLPDGDGLSLAAEVRRTGPGGPALVALTGSAGKQRKPPWPPAAPRSWVSPTRRPSSVPCSPPPSPTRCEGPVMPAQSRKPAHQADRQGAPAAGRRMRRARRMRPPLARRRISGPSSRRSREPTACWTPAW